MTEESAPNIFAAELEHWRGVRGLNRKDLGEVMGYSRPYVSKILSGTPPSEAFARSADAALRAGGALRRAFDEYAAGRPVTGRTVSAAVPAEHETGSLVVDVDHATLAYDGQVYRLTQRRRLINQSTEPITRYLIRISVDRFPGDPDRSNALYDAYPLTWEEIDLHAWHGAGRAEPMNWEPHHDRNMFKEVWLQFSSETRHFPLYPGQACWIEYEYTVTDAHWGNWFQRAVRLPTNLLQVRLEFPAHLHATVWGLQTSMTAQAAPFRTPIAHHQSEDGQDVYDWSTDSPPLHARYRLEWDLPHRGHDDRTPPSQVMAGLGIVQEGDPLLREVARSFDLPAEAEDARRVVTELQSAASRVAQAHTFSKGMGLAAPQIGIGRAASIVRTPEGDWITLFNPRIVEMSGESDEQYEGCLSYFDLRGKVPRPMSITVEHTDIDGRTRITEFVQGVARLVAHEVDHLEGVLYLDRMRPGVEPIPVEQYRGTGSAWNYEARRA
ncbi:peptide deformylase [Nocardia brasiliensis]